MRTQKKSNVSTPSCRRAFEQQTRFSWYHQKKAELIANVYALLNDVSEYVKEMVSPLQLADDESRHAHAKATFDLYNKLAAEYFGKKIFLEREICEKVESILGAVKEAIMDFRLSQDPQLRDARLWGKASRTMIKDVPPLLAEFEHTFRSMLSAIGPAS